MGVVCGLTTPLQQMFQPCKTKAERLLLPGEKSAGLPRGQVKFHLLFVLPPHTPARPSLFPGLSSNPESATKDAAPPPPQPNPLTPARSPRPRAPPAARLPIFLWRGAPLSARLPPGAPPVRDTWQLEAPGEEGALPSARGGGAGRSKPPSCQRRDPGGGGTSRPQPPSFISLIPAVAALGSQPSEAAVPCTLHLTKDDDK